MLAGAAALASPACGPWHHPRAKQQARSPPRHQQQQQLRRQAGAPPPLPPLRATAPSPEVAGYETDNDGQTVEQRLETVKTVVATSDISAPYDRSAVNPGLMLWGAIRNIPQRDRTQLLSRLDSEDIKRLWKVAGQRYRAPKQQVAAAIGPELPLWHDLPRAGATGRMLSEFQGKAALPSHALGISSFSKAFFLHPGTGQLYGRVLLGKGPLGDALYPLYFRAAVGPCVVPTTQDPADMVLQYLPPEELGLGPADLPRPRWPAPGPQLPPFHEGFADYVRAVAPGVYVGLGYRTASTEPNDPLYFLMVHQWVTAQE